MVVQDRIQKAGWVNGRSFAGVNHSFKRTLEQRSIAAPRSNPQQKTRSLVKSDVRWFAYALMVIGAGCLAAAFLQDSQAHPWMPLLLGWAGTVAIIRGILSKDSPKA